MVFHRHTNHTKPGETAMRLARFFLSQKETTIMKEGKTILRTIAAVLLLTVHSLTASADDKTIRLFDAVVFYNGYLYKENPDSAKADGVLRHSTSNYAVCLTDEQLNAIGDSLTMSVCVKACCDEYDRIGNINLAFVEKDSVKYDPAYHQHIELGRFITPFMNKNKQPDTVPYAYDLSYVSAILRDRSIREKYNIWVEFELFGVPSSAQRIVEGCADRIDVFQGTLYFHTSTPAAGLIDSDVLVPIVMKKTNGSNLNNYDAAATDTIGKTTKTYTFDVPRDVTDAQIVLVTSNHGAEMFGEEYMRRWHYVYVDDQLGLVYKPGRTSCEPFRKYNTQRNGIYSDYELTDEEWQSFSNWCPGDVIDNRIIHLGAMKAGQHKVRISVPEAEFYNQSGDIPVSMFFQGTTEGQLTAIRNVQKVDPFVQVTVGEGVLTLQSSEGIMGIEIYDLGGKKMRTADLTSTISTVGLPKGVYIVNAELTNNIVESHKILLK